jgi:hypothetical protein
LAARSANSFSSVFGAPIHKKIIMLLVESSNEDCNCDVVVSTLVPKEAMIALQK